MKGLQDPLHETIAGRESDICCVESWWGLQPDNFRDFMGAARGRSNCAIKLVTKVPSFDSPQPIHYIGWTSS